MPDLHERQFGKKEQVPQNPKLWALLTKQARARFHPYPSLPASKWIHSEYVKRGGIFVDSKKKDTRHNKRGEETHKGKKERQEEEKQDRQERSKGEDKD